MIRVANLFALAITLILVGIFKFVGYAFDDAATYWSIGGFILATVVWQTAHWRRYGFTFEPPVIDIERRALISDWPETLRGKWPVAFQMAAFLALLVIGFNIVEDRIPDEWSVGCWWLLCGAFLGAAFNMLAHRSRYGCWLDPPIMDGVSSEAARGAAEALNRKRPASRA